MSQSTPDGQQFPRGQFFPPEVRQKMCEDLKLTGKALRTQNGYLRAVRQLSDHARKSPTEVSELEVRAFFLYLKEDLDFAYGSLRVALSGIKFFFANTCKRDWQIFEMLKLQNVNAIPEVLSINDVFRLIDETKTLRMYAYFWTVYTMGLRLNEALHLEFTDIKTDRGIVHIHRGKGAKDRCVPLPLSTLAVLREYWKTHRHPRLLFPADGRNHTLAKQGVSQAQNPMSETAVQGAMKKIVKKLALGKGVSIHTLRHSYATHLLEAGVSLKVIQKYLGHSSLQTTMIYLHLTDLAEANAREVIEDLFGKLPGQNDDDDNGAGSLAKLK
jgi:integrase/recombinase XerD